MRYATTPRWVYVMLIVMGIGFGAGAIAFWLFAPPPTGAIVGTIWMLMAAGFVFFSMRALASRRDDERIRREGLRATATVLSANTTGWMINNVPQWKLNLRIDGAGASYETAMKLQTFNPPPNGASFSVRVDPVRKQHIVMADDADDAATGAAASATVLNASGTDVGATVVDALRRAGLLDGAATAVVNPDGSRTITSTSVTTGGGSSDAAETVRALADLDRMHASGVIGDAEFDVLKRKLLGES